jgi:hypothetical protein
MGTDANRIQSLFGRFTSELVRSGTDIMPSDPNEGPMPTNCPDTYIYVSEHVVIPRC